MTGSATIKTPSSTASFAAAIMIALLLAEGLHRIVQAVAMPLESVAIRAIDAVLMLGWRDVMLFDQESFTPSLFAFTTLEGLVLIALALAIGLKLIPARSSK